MTDEEILLGLRRRDPTALAALFDAFVDPVYRLVCRILDGAGSPQDAEESTNDVFQAAWEQIGQFDPARAPLRTWLLMLAKYVALKRRRKLRPPAGDDLSLEQEPPGAEGQPEAELARAEERRTIQAALDELPPVDKQLVYRRYFLGERVDRLAEALGLSRQAADNRLWRARKSLRARLTGIILSEVAGDE